MTKVEELLLEVIIFTNEHPYGITRESDSYKKLIDFLKQNLKTEKDELLIELGKNVFYNLGLLDDRILETDEFSDYKVVMIELLEIIKKIREMV